jgi:hypothetical protein
MIGISQSPSDASQNSSEWPRIHLPLTHSTQRVQTNSASSRLEMTNRRSIFRFRIGMSIRGRSPALIPTQHHILDESNRGIITIGASLIHHYELRPQWTADKITNWLFASAADSQFRHIIELSPPAFWAALEIASPWTSLGEYVLDFSVPSNGGAGK